MLPPGTPASSLISALVEALNNARSLQPLDLGLVVPEKIRENFMVVLTETRFGSGPPALHGRKINLGPPTRSAAQC